MTGGIWSYGEFCSGVTKGKGSSEGSNVVNKGVPQRSYILQGEFCVQGIEEFIGVLSGGLLGILLLLKRSENRKLPFSLFLGVEISLSAESTS